MNEPAVPEHPRFAVCVVGWYFREGFYRELAGLEGADVYVVSHKARHEIPAGIVAGIAADRLLVRPNAGYDWGAYQQFLESGPWRGYDAIVFMQDDIEVTSGDFLGALARALRIHPVVGNGALPGGRIRARDNAESYGFARCKPPSGDFEHDNVRGSFFAITREALERLGSFEVFWDRFALTSGFGNWSTRATCAKLQGLLGPECFGYLSQTYRRSDYILEQERGGEGRQAYSGRRAYWIGRVGDWSRRYMSLHWGGRDAGFRRLRLWSLGAAIGLFSGGRRS